MLKRLPIIHLMNTDSLYSDISMSIVKNVNFRHKQTTTGGSGELSRIMGSITQFLTWTRITLPTHWLGPFNLQWLLLLLRQVLTRASNESSRRFHNHRDGPYHRCKDHKGGTAWRTYANQPAHFFALLSPLNFYLPCVNTSFRWWSSFSSITREFSVFRSGKEGKYGWREQTLQWIFIVKVVS